jgi:hypothetical protein
MIVDVASAAELQDLGARAVDLACAEDGWQVELRLAPGRYDGVPVVLGTYAPHLRRLIMRAADPDDPPRLTDLNLRLCAADVALHDLVIGPTRSGLPVVALVGDRVAMQGCTLTGSSLRAEPGSSLVQFVARGEDVPTAAVVNCWFVDNRAPPGCAVIALEGHRRGFELVEVTGTAFVANRAPCAVLQRAVRVDFASCVTIPAPGAPPDDVFLDLAALDAVATFEDCLLAWSQLDRLVADAGTQASPAVRIARSVLAFTGPDMANVQLDGVTFAAPAPEGLGAALRVAEQAASARSLDLATLASALGIGAP